MRIDLLHGEYTHIYAPLNGRARGYVTGSRLGDSKLSFTPGVRITREHYNRLDPYSQHEYDRQNIGFADKKAAGTSDAKNFILSLLGQGVKLTEAIAEAKAAGYSAAASEGAGADIEETEAGISPTPFIVGAAAVAGIAALMYMKNK